MPPFSLLLSRTLQRCNRSGTMITAVVVVLGALLVAAQVFLWSGVAQSVMNEAKMVLGEERFAELQSQADTVSPGQESQLMGQAIVDKVEQMLAAVPEQQRDAFFVGLFKGVLLEMPLSTYVLALVVAMLLLIARLLFLSIASQHGTPSAVARHALRRLGPGALTWIGMGLASCVWLPFAVMIIGFFWSPILLLALPSFVPFLALYPRLVFAPVIAQRPGIGPRQALQMSFEYTRGRYWIVGMNLLGIGAVLWVADSMLGFLLQTLVSVLLPFAPFALAFFWLTPVLGLVLLAYRMMFVTIMEEQLRSVPQPLDVSAL